MSSPVAPNPHPPHPSTGFLGSVGMPSTGPHLSLPSLAPGKTSSVRETGAVVGAALPRPVSAMQHDSHPPVEQLVDPGAYSKPFTSLAGRPPTQLPPQKTMCSSDKTLSSYTPTLFPAMSSIATRIISGRLRPVPARLGFRSSATRTSGPNVLQQMSSSDGQWSWAQLKSGLKQADGSGAPQVMRQRQVETDGLSRDNSSASSSSPGRQSPPSKQLRADSTSPIHRSCSQDDRWRSPDSSRRQASSRSYASHHSCSPVFQSQRRRSRDRSFLSHWRSRLAWLGDLLGTILCHETPFSISPGSAIIPGLSHVPSVQKNVPQSPALLLQF